MRSDETGGTGNDYSQISSKPSFYWSLNDIHMLHSVHSDMTDASWTERAVVLVLIAASLALFWWRFRKVLFIIRGSRPTPDFEVAPLGPRIRDFLWEVAAQGKVIRQR